MPRMLWIKDKRMIIDDFMAQYERARDYYEKAAFLCKQICETELSKAGMKAIVTSRAKSCDKLRKKIQERNEEKHYLASEDIDNDIPDFAGVRIALYLPGDRDELDEIINYRFEVKSRIKDFRHSPSPYEKRFSGYQATHYRIHLREDHLANDQKQYAKTLIEIQVTTVFMHAWSEIEHDLNYKHATGKPSEDEYAILDEINGLVLAGEIALERLQRAIKRRWAY
jgi:ppGpp synthetase/RelA/SpoT-type nucleotidyltranferase